MRTIYRLLAVIMIFSLLTGTVTVNAKAEPSTWSVTDGLGRTAPLNNETGNTRKDRYVAMFFWDWHTYFKVWKPYNVNNIIEEHPEAANDFENSVWGNTGSGVPMFWNEPVYGYYTSSDKYVIRKQAELLADAGVDVIFFDCTNDTLLFADAFKVICQTFQKAKEDGVNVPKVGFMLNINPNYMMKNNNSELKTIYKRKRV